MRAAVGAFLLVVIVALDLTYITRSSPANILATASAHRKEGLDCSCGGITVNDDRNEDDTTTTATTTDGKYFKDLPPRFEYLNQRYAESLQSPCTTDYYFDHWYGLGSQMNIYTFVLMDTLLANKTMGVHPLAFVDGKKRLGQFATKSLLKYFESEEFPICFDNKHPGKFINDQGHLKTWTKFQMTYEELFQIQTSMLFHMVENVRSPIQQRVKKQLKRFTRPFSSFHVRWGDKVSLHEAEKTELEVFLDKLQMLDSQPSTLHMMTTEKNVTRDFERLSGIPTINLYDDLLVEMLVAAQADHVFCTESSNICRVIWKLRNGKNITNVEHRKNKYPIRFWLAHFTRDDVPKKKNVPKTKNVPTKKKSL